MISLTRSGTARGGRLQSVHMRRTAVGGGGGRAHRASRTRRRRGLLLGRRGRRGALCVGGDGSLDGACYGDVVSSGDKQLSSGGKQLGRTERHARPGGPTHWLALRDARRRRLVGALFAHLRAPPRDWARRHTCEQRRSGVSDRGVRPPGQGAAVVRLMEARTGLSRVTRAAPSSRGAAGAPARRRGDQRHVRGSPVPVG